VGLLQAAPDREALRADLERAGADYVVEDFLALAKLLMSS
jgi:hypothetical protein